MHILEAGCGRNWPFQLEGINAALTGFLSTPRYQDPGAIAEGF